MDEYDVAQICLNGHVINSSFNAYPQFNKKFCDDCGAATIIKCQECSQEIQGRYKDSISIKTFQAPKYCLNCGKSFPWTSSAIETAQELTKELENLSDEEKKILNKSIAEIVKDTPRTELEASKFKKIMLKVGKSTASGFERILVNVVSETVKKIIWGS